MTISEAIPISSKFTEQRARAKFMLFLCPLGNFRNDSESPVSLDWPQCPAYWSLYPSGSDRLSEKAATDVGFPTIQIVNLPSVPGENIGTQMFTLIYTSFTKPRDLTHKAGILLGTLSMSFINFPRRR
ncbi:hypothetical protein R3P38DRAFT_512010 [Favolaschia claudopus]|uniref:Uncharacterized protein n=1 Tax=Favolaschia claudopus TaxID=2862362 RepID=A0AAV9ZDB0_9AGAR